MNADLNMTPDAVAEKLVESLARLSELTLASEAFMKAMHKDHLNNAGQISTATMATAGAWAAEVEKASKFMLGFCAEAGVE